MNPLHQPPSGGNDNACAFEIDPRLVFLQRAAARLTLFEAGEIEIDEAFDGLVPAFRAMDWEIPDIGFKGAVTRNRGRATSEAAVEAVMYAVRTRGLEALREPATKGRLARCDAAAKAQINKRIARLFPERKAA